MAMNEITVTGRKFRRLIDKEKALWQKISFWHKATDCEFNDGKNAEEKLGAINGITSNIDDDGDDICASISLVKNIIEQLKASFLDGYKKIIDALIAAGIIESDEGDGLSPEDIAELIKNSSGKYKYHSITLGSEAGSTLTYTCKKTGWYNIYADYIAKNNDAHKAVSNTVKLTIGAKSYTLYDHRFDTGTNTWKTTGQGKYVDKIHCNENTIIKLTVSGFSINDANSVSETNPQTKVYTIGTLVII